MKKLSALKPGTRAIIQKIEDPESHLKLMEMGCLPGEEVVVYRIAPLGDPLSIRVSGYNLSLRKEEAEAVWVEEQ
ncbi:MAG: ferrous iron transport protein A [Bacteroidota bacterium]|jgi:ferrous iron transport protein A